MKTTPHYIIAFLLCFCFAGCIHEHPGGIDSTLVRLDVDLVLNLEWLPYEASSSEARSEKSNTPLRRFIVKLYKENELVLDSVFYSADITSTQTTLSLSDALKLHAAQYKIMVWMDYVYSKEGTNLCYNTSHFPSITLITPYTAGTDLRRCASVCETIDLRPYCNHWNEQVQIEIPIVCPLAKYQIIATDVERYQQLVAANNYPPLEELTTTIFYEGFFPNSFNITTGKPNDAITGVSTNSLFSAFTTNEVQIATDHVLTSSEDSFVRATMRITDSNGRIITQVSGIRVNYRRNHLTTIRGQFLTAGKTSGGVNIDTEWNGEYIIEF